MVNILKEIKFKDGEDNWLFIGAIICFALIFFGFNSLLMICQR